jgi:hypothetical protein
MDGKEIHPAIGSTATATPPAQQPHPKVVPEVVPARKTLAIAVDALKALPSRESPLRQFARTSASVSPKDVMGKAWDNAAKTEVPNVEGMSKPRAEAPRSDDMEGPTSASQPQKILHDDLSRDVWYILATLFGAVFTYILAPVVVEIIRGRIARHHANQTQDSLRPVARGQPT